ncbi:malate synthase A [Micromonospora marina]|uniref:malate synthase A n=1 Tax=Micromonospora marina TaxID=307120 RepID=UPI00345475C7
MDDVTGDGRTAPEARIMTLAARAFLADLHRAFRDRRTALLAARETRRGTMPRFRPDTVDIRYADWRVPPPAPGLERRLVEITGPVGRRMSINALNSGADVWLADFEDATTPHWDILLAGQANLYDAVCGTITHTSEDGRHYRLDPAARRPTIVVRPRGWHLDETHVLIDGAPAVGALVDFGLYFFHNALRLVVSGSGPYFYLPKLEDHTEAALWADIFEWAEEALGLTAGTIRATVLIETVPAAFQMDEILHALRGYAAGLNAGRWDYLFSMVKTFRHADGDTVLPDRQALTMSVPFMRAYADLLVATCHRRGAMAIGGMSAFVPSRHDPAATAQALAGVAADKRREARAGFDGSWVAHPALIETCRAEFAAVLGDRPHQIGTLRPDVRVSGDDLLDVRSAASAVTRAGVESNVSVAVRYLTSWLSGRAAVAIDSLMEDVATAEIARAQVWQWHRHGVRLDDGRVVDRPMVEELVRSTCSELRDRDGLDPAVVARAADLFREIAMGDEFVEFLTIPGARLLAAGAPLELA